MNPAFVGLSAYTLWQISARDYARFARRLRGKDAGYFTAPYAQWRAEADAFGQRLRLLGVKVRRVRLQAHAYARWCAAEHREPGAASFKRFARLAALELNQPNR